MKSKIKKVKAEKNFFADEKPKDWSTKRCKRPSEVLGPIYRDRYLFQIRDNIGFPLGANKKRDIKGRLSSDQQMALKELIKSEITDNNIADVHRYLMYIALIIGRCEVFEFNSKPEELTSEVYENLMLLPLMTKIKSVTIEAELITPDNVVTRRMSFDERTHELLTTFENILFRAKTFAFTKGFYIGRDFPSDLGDEVKKYRHIFSGSYTLDNNRSKILLIYLNEVVTHLVDIKAIKLRSPIKIFVLRMVFLCGGFGLQNRLKGISEINSDPTSENYDYLVNVYKRAMTLRNTFYDEFRQIWDSYDNLDLSKYSKEEIRNIIKEGIQETSFIKHVPGIMRGLNSSNPS